MKLFLLASVSAFALVGTSADALAMFSDTTPGASTFTAPTAGSYKIDVYGAQGGNASYEIVDYAPGASGGLGAGIGGVFTLAAGETLSLRVGAMGLTPSSPTSFLNDSEGGGGGGGSFVQGDNLLVIGGGGGGGANRGLIGQNGSASPGDGLGGDGGSAGPSTFGEAGGGGGGGFKSDGGYGQSGYASVEGAATAGNGGEAFPILSGGGGGSGALFFFQGKGGGGGGGGYSGGDGGDAYSSGGGGGSIGGTILGYQAGDGMVTIDQLTSVPEPTTWSLITSGIGLLGWMMRRRRHARAASVIMCNQSTSLDTS